MNTTQTTTTTAALIAFLAGIAAAKFGGDAATWTTLFSGVIGVGATAFNLWTTRKAALVTATAQLPEVKSVQLCDSAPADLVKATPDNVKK